MIEYVDGLTMKKLAIPRSDMLAMIRKHAAPGFRFCERSRKPLDHQLLSLLFHLQFDGSANWGDMGSGKTKISIDATAAKGIKRNVLVVTVNAALDNWKSEFEMNQPQYRVSVVRGTTAEKNMILEESSADVYVVSFDGLIKGKREAHERDVRDYILPALDRKWDMLIVDESRAVCNPQSKRTKVCMKLARQSRNRMLLSGLPIAKSSMEAWSQQYCLDAGMRLGRSFRDFQWMHFNKVNKWKYHEWVPAEGTDEMVRDVLQDTGIRWEKKECLDLPGFSEVIRYVELSGDQRRFYDKLKEEKRVILMNRKKYREIQAVLQKFMQITGGSLKVGDETVRFKDNCKLAELEYLLENDLRGRKVVVTAFFIEDQRMIIERLEKMGLRPLSILAGADGAFDTCRKFNESRDRNLVVLSEAVGSRALNLQGAEYMATYSQDFDTDRWKQLRERIYRIGQKNKVTYIKLVARNTVDERVWQVIDEDKKLIDLVLSSKNLGELI